MLAIALGFLSLVLLSAPLGRTGLTFQAIIALGSFATAVGLVACIWGQRFLTGAMSVLLIGFGSVLAIAVLPVAALASYLQALGVTIHAPIALNAGWSNFTMALGDVVCGLALILAGSRRTTVAFISFTIVRVCLWGGAFWQLANTMLRGRLSRLFDSPDRAAVQIGLTLAFAVMIPLLFRGDRGWMRTFYAPDTRHPMSRSILPVALLPVIVAYAISFGSHLDTRDGAAFTLLNIEIVTACLVLAAMMVLRTRMGRRHVQDEILDALQSAPAIVMSPDGYIEYWTAECAQIYGFPPEEAVGRHASTLLKTEFGESSEQIVSSMETSDCWSGEVAQWTREGRRLRILLRLAFHKSERDQDLKIVATMSEITQPDLGAPSRIGPLEPGI